MAEVNPPPQMKLPKEFQEKPEIREYYRHFDRMILQLWQRTGGGEDFINDTGDSLTSTSSRVSRNAARINSLELKEFEIVQVTADVETEENQILICKNVLPIEVTLDLNAVAEDEVHIKRRGAEILVLGLIDGDLDLIINVLNFSLHLVFDGTDWSSI